MTLDDLRALADEFFEWPIAHNKSNITMTSALLFAQHVVQTRETQLRTEYSATMTTLRDAAKQALEALEISYDVAKAEADRYHTAMAGFRPEHHAQLDADVQQIAVAITALRAALAEPVQEPRSFIGLELPEIDDAINSNITITDYKLRDGIYGAILDIEMLLKEKNERG